MISLVAPHSTCLTQHLNRVDITTYPVAVPAGKRSKQAAKKLLECIEKSKPELFFIMKDPQITPTLLRLVKKKSPRTKIIMWYGDQRGNIVVPLIKNRLPYLDCLLTTNNSTIQHTMYKNAGIRHVHTFYHSFSIQEFKLFNTKPSYDIFFGGSNFKKTKFPLSAFRTKLVTALHNEFKMIIHGGGWPFPAHPWILRPQYARALRKGHMNLGVNHYDIRQYYNRRLFESVASGRLHITYYIPGMEQHFKNHKHLVWFKSIKEAIDVFNYYLKHKKARNKIESVGRSFFITNHSWPQRVVRFRHIVDKVLK